MDCYIYYKTTAEHESQVIACTKLLQQAVAETMGLQMRLQRRPEAGAGLLTWMEIYRDIPADFHSSLTKLINQHKLISLISGERHAEYFMDALVCA
ncbi:DUF4936 family protein [Undibacterium piscinae]|uniref:DUF4936 family protein n=1 Tax=Undibacterium piscinae TaxID=2495591 RepID=A0A6M3ZZR1_9BURK|nr:DUF4936 family protein [Undibacterium piscinae]